MRFRPGYTLLMALPCLPLLASFAVMSPALGQAKTGASAPASAAKPLQPQKQILPQNQVLPIEVVKTPVDVAGIEFFEKKVRPVLAEQCYSCHSLSAKKSLGNLTLDSRASLLKGGASGPSLVPGHPDQSKLIEAVCYAKPDLQMPPKGKMTPAVLADLTEWVKMGAPWPSERAPIKTLSAKETAIELHKRQHWAFQSVRQTKPPVVKAKTWPRSAIDQFLLAKMETKGLLPAPSADRRTLMRRAYFDLTGLPPSPEEVTAFIADKSPTAWADLIDRLLASPHYGERWGRYWLDVARYGEDQAHTFEARVYPQGYRYRDWLARAFNADMPYDRFVKEQIAADLLDQPDMRDQLPALGFFAMGPVYYGDEKMYDQYDDRIDTLSRGFLGLTVACARCHDHKFDPISQKDYYALAGVFASTKYLEVPIGEANGKTAFGKTEACVNRQDLINAQNQQVEKFTNEQREHLREALTPEIARYMVAAWKLQNRRKADAKITTDQIATAEGVQSVVLERWAKYLKEGAGKDRAALAAWRQMVQKQDAGKDVSAAAPSLANAKQTAAAFQEVVLSLQKRRLATVANTAKDKPQPADKSDKSAPVKLDNAETALLDDITGKEGVLTLPDDQIEKALSAESKTRLIALKTDLEHVKTAPFVHAISEGAKIANVPILLRGNPNTPGEEAPRHFLCIVAGDNAPVFKQGSGRLELANAIADKNNPLTARVMVNRIWQHHFGTGLVRTASNFGLLGEPPTHPELLDYLAAQFVQNGWSIKQLHRQIMLSAVYKMSGTFNKHNYEVDPDNRMLWRMPERRLEVEAWRDTMLAVTNKLDLTVGGPSVPLSSPDNNRRTYYAAVSRHDLDSMLRMFDYPDPNVTADTRMNTTVPLQQLFVLNSEFMIRQAKAFAARLNAAAGETDSARIRRAFLLAYNRTPDTQELAMGLAFLQQPKPLPVTPTTSSAGGEKSQLERAAALTRWEQYAQALLSANEFMYID